MQTFLHVRKAEQQLDILDIDITHRKNTANAANAQSAVYTYLDSGTHFHYFGSVQHIGCEMKH